MVEDQSLKVLPVNIIIYDANIQSKFVAPLMPNFLISLIFSGNFFQTNFLNYKYFNFKSRRLAKTVGTLTRQDKINFAKVLSTRIILEASFFFFFSLIQRCINYVNFTTIIKKQLR